MPPIRGLRRSATDSKLGGVCGGVAEHWQIDPTLVRVGAAVLVFSAGIGVALYGAAWLLVPRAGEQLSLVKQKSAWARARSDRTLWIIGAVLAVAFIAGFGSSFPMGIWPAVVIAAIWFFGFRNKGTKPTPPPAVSPTTSPFDEAATAWIARVHEHQHTGGDSSQPEPGRPQPEVDTAGSESVDVPNWSSGTSASTSSPMQAFVPTQYEPLPHESHHPTPPGRIYEPTGAEYNSPVRVAPAPVAERRRWRGWLVGLILVASGLAVLGTMAAAGVVVPGAAFPAVVVLGLAVTLILGAWFRRPRGMIAVAVILAVAATAGSFIPRDITTWKFVSTSHTFEASSDLPATIEQDAGDLTLDLTNLKVDESRTVIVRMKMGEVTVRLPRTANAQVEWALNLGNAKLPSGSADGPDISGTYTSRPDSDHPDQVLRLQIHIELGDLAVTQ